MLLFGSYVWATTTTILVVVVVVMPVEKRSDGLGIERPVGGCMNRRGGCAWERLVAVVLHDESYWDELVEDSTQLLLDHVLKKG